MTLHSEATATPLLRGFSRKIIFCQKIFDKGTRQKKMWKIPHLGGGSGPEHFPHFKKRLSD